MNDFLKGAALGALGGVVWLAPAVWGVLSLNVQDTLLAAIVVFATAGVTLMCRLKGDFR